ncbi:MAG: aminopeptidase, partial [Planctomycetota bacterium]|nr:aminopeptidase [Planctomycetota bacterium]
MKKLNTASVCLALIVVACNTEAPGSASAMDAALDEITQEGIYAHYAYLADDKLEGRLTGEPGYDLAAAYVAEQFAAIGLEPGGDEGWYQQVPLVSYLVDGDSSSAVAHRD